MIKLAVQLAALPQGLSEGTIEAIGRLAAASPTRVLMLPEDIGAALPPQQQDTTWLVIGMFTDARRHDLLTLQFGSEGRGADSVWARDPSALKNLLSTPSAGIERLLGATSVSAIHNQIRAGFGPALAALEKYRAAYVFGTRRLGRVVGEGVERLGLRVKGFFDNNRAVWGQTLMSAPVHGIGEQHDRDVPVIIGTTRFPFSLGRQLREAGFRHILPYPVMTLLDDARFPPEIPYRDLHHDIVANRARYLSEYLNYADDRSREVLDRLLLYRLTFDAAHVQLIFDPEPGQYFDPDVIRLTPDEVFVDAGGFDGQTTLGFIERAGGSYRHIYYFEPDARLMQRSRSILAGRPAIEFFEAGVFSRDGSAYFCATGTVNGSVSDVGGDIEIRVRRIDSVVNEPPTFIKMDIEGIESSALEGARETIGRYAPKLAIAAYHSGPDIWRLGTMIRDFRRDYQLYLRHYTEGGLETVLYAIPQ